MSTPTIAIIGAGLSGLVCARILQLHGIPVSVYELDVSSAARQQGGSLDIHTDSGQIALTEAGLYDSFSANTHPGGEAMRVMDKTAHVAFDQEEPEGGNGRPEIDRKLLRQMFVDSLEPGTIHWGRKLVSVRPAEVGHELEFADGQRVRADLVVGADGAWSRVRPRLTRELPAYTGITVVESGSPTPSRLIRMRSRWWGGECVRALGQQVHRWPRRRSDVDRSWHARGRGLDHGIRNRLERSGGRRASLVAQFADWAPALTDLIREATMTSGRDRSTHSRSATPGNTFLA